MQNSNLSQSPQRGSSQIGDIAGLRKQVLDIKPQNNLQPKQIIVLGRSQVTTQSPDNNKGQSINLYNTNNAFYKYQGEQGFDNCESDQSLQKENFDGSRESMKNSQREINLFSPTKQLRQYQGMLNQHQEQAATYQKLFNNGNKKQTINYSSESPYNSKQDQGQYENFSMKMEDHYQLSQGQGKPKSNNSKFQNNQSLNNSEFKKINNNNSPEVVKRCSSTKKHKQSNIEQQMKISDIIKNCTNKKYFRISSPQKKDVKKNFGKEIKVAEIGSANQLQIHTDMSESQSDISVDSDDDDDDEEQKEDPEQDSQDGTTQDTLSKGQNQNTNNNTTNNNSNSSTNNTTNNNYTSAIQQSNISNTAIQQQQQQQQQQQSKQVKKDVLLLESIYKNRPPTVFFQYPAFCNQIRDQSRVIKITELQQQRYELKYKVFTHGTPYRCLTNVFKCAGFEITEDQEWNVAWGLTKMKDKIAKMNKYQKINHFPGYWNLGRKDNLWKNLSRTKRKYQQEYDFIPNTYLLQHNTDWDRFLISKENADKDHLWIMKPVASGQGRGVKMISKQSKVKKRNNYLICEYIANPHLINGLKYDLRIYVLCTSYDPLRIYLYNEGLTRFATEKYTTNTKDLSTRYVHLTNYSVNKYNQKQFIKNQDSGKDDQGSKWSISALKNYYKNIGVNIQELWDKIKDIVVKTLISAEPFMTDMYQKCDAHRNNSFELYGFDILIDNTMKPWLLEVNVQASLSSSSPLDKRIKNSLICDIMNLIGMLPYDKKKYDEDLKKKIPGHSPSKQSKYYSKNIRDLDDLNENNCLEKLSWQDWKVLFETDEENYRKGNFERIYPVKEKMGYYSQFFQFQRYYNLMIEKWFMSETNFLEKILKKISNQTC